MKRTPLKRTAKRARYATKSQVPDEVRDDVWRRMSELGLAPFPPGRPRAGWLIRSTIREDSP